jgi:hypothetical protein
MNGSLDLRGVFKVSASSHSSSEFGVTIIPNEPGEGGETVILIDSLNENIL